MKNTSENTLINNNIIGKLKKFNFQAYGNIFALVVLFIISIFLGYPHFLKIQNLLNILRQISYTGIIALGMTFVIIVGGIDLSVGSITAFTGTIAILTINMVAGLNMPPYIGVIAAILAALVVGSVAGSINGFFITKGNIAPFIVTLGTMAIFRSLSLFMADAGEFRSVNQLYGKIGASSFLYIPTPVWIFLILATLLSFLLRKTKYGRYVRAVGSNARVARYSAIDVSMVRFFTYLINGLLVGVSAVLISMRFNSVGTATFGVNYEMDAIASVIIGGTVMTGGKGTIWGTVIGAIILGIINNMLNMVGVSPYLQGTVKGLVIIGAVFIQRQNNSQ